MGGGMQRDPYFDDDRSYCYRQHVGDAEWRAVLALRPELVALADAGNEHAQAFCDFQDWDTQASLQKAAEHDVTKAEAELRAAEQATKDAQKRLAAARQRKAKTRKKTRKPTGHGTRCEE